MPPNKPIHRLLVLYDGACPLCTSYVRRIRIAENVAQIELLNARDQAALVAGFRERGIEINRGMIVMVDDELYYAEDALRVLAALSTGWGPWNRLSAFLFRSPRRASVFYLMMVAGRRTLLCLMRRSQIA
ncbi:MAG: DCC1-like thiol-disulfide oxidoreductase family protein [Stellaceae bacterium]